MTSPTSPIRVALRKPLDDRIRSGHPWLFDESVVADGEFEPGTVVDVYGVEGGFVARGIWDPESPIRVRAFTRVRAEALGAGLVRQRVEAAWALRRERLDLTAIDAFRLIHGEADGLPGIVCDVYGEVAVIQLDTEAVAGLLPAVTSAIRESVAVVRHVVRKARRGEPGPSLVALAGSVPRRPVLVRENGLQFRVDIAGGQKTGFFLDQRDNRARVRALARGRRVLDLFAYTGGFSVSAAAGGATRITSVDAAAPATAAIAANLALNGFNAASRDVRIITEDVFRFLENDKSGYELVICDPPSMAAARSARAGALAAYARLNAMALARVVPGGRLCTASCSSRVSLADLTGVVQRAAKDVRRTIRIVRRSGAAPDHPVVPAFPEGRYLAWLEVLVDGGGGAGGAERRAAPSRGGRPPARGRGAAPPGKPKVRRGGRRGRAP